MNIQNLEERPNKPGIYYLPPQDVNVIFPDGTEVYLGTLLPQNMPKKEPEQNTATSLIEDQKTKVLSRIEEIVGLSGQEKVAADLLLSSKEGLTHAEWRKKLSADLKLPEFLVNNILKNLRVVLQKRGIPINKTKLNHEVVYSFGDLTKLLV